MKTLPTALLAYTPIAMLYAALSVVSSLLSLKPSLYYFAFDCNAFVLVLLLLLIYRKFGLKQSLYTTLVAELSLTLFMLISKLAVIFPAANTWPYQKTYASILNFSWAYISTFLFAYLSISLAALAIFHNTWKTNRQSPPTYLYPFIGMLFVSILLTCNITTQKIATLFGITVDVGTWFFPLVFIFNNIFTEIYGYGSSRIIIWSGLLINSLIAFVLAAVVLLPAQHWPQQTAFALIAGMAFRIVFASMISYFCSEFTNSYVLAKLKILMRGKFLWVRTISSTATAMIVDSILFTVIAFAGVLPLPLLVTVAVFQYALKVSFEIIFTPATYAIVSFLKQKEKFDYYDVNTNFNPFLLFKKSRQCSKSSA